MVGAVSSEDFFHHMAMYVCEAVVTACVAVGQFFVVDAHEVQEGRVEVMDVNLVPD